MRFKDVLANVPRYVDVLYHTDDAQGNIKGSGSVGTLRNKKELQDLLVVSMVPIGPYTLLVRLVTQEGEHEYR